MAGRQDADTNNPNFKYGFMFALQVIQNIDTELDINAIENCLIELKNGEITLIGSPHDTIRKIEKDVNKPLPDILKESVYQLLSRRSEMYEFHKQAAISILQMMGEPT